MKIITKENLEAYHKHIKEKFDSKLDNPEGGVLVRY